MVRRSWIPLTLALTLLGSGVAPFFPAHEARADETARARKIFQEALQLETGENFAGALAKFQEVAQIKRSPQVLFHIAFCQAKLGQLVAAVGGFRLVILEGGEEAANAQVVQASKEELAALEKRVPSVVFKRGKGAELAKVTLDGVELGKSSLDKPQQVDPGAHSVEATARGKLPFKEVIEVAEGETKTLEIVLKDAPAEGPGPVASAEPEAGDKNPVVLGNDDLKKAAKSPVLPYAVLGAGTASLVASGVFFYLRSSAISDLDKSCRGNICPESSKSTSDSGKTATLLANITLGLGVVGVGVGSVLLFTSKPEEQSATARARGRAMDVVLHPGPRGGGASLVGTF
jgi:hypothetical protein